MRNVEVVVLEVDGGRVKLGSLPLGMCRSFVPNFITNWPTVWLLMRAPTSRNGSTRRQEIQSHERVEPRMR